MNSNNLIAFFLTLKSIDSYNYPQEVYRFLNDKTLINYADTDGKTPLHIVAERGNVGLCIHLLKEGAFITKDNYGKTPIDYAIQNGWGRCACLILEKKMERDLIFQKKIEREKNNPFKPPRVLKRGESLQPKIEVIFSKTPFSDIPQSSIEQPKKEPTLKEFMSEDNKKYVIKPSLEEAKIKLKNALRIFKNCIITTKNKVYEDFIFYSYEEGVILGKINEIDTKILEEDVIKVTSKDKVCIYEHIYDTREPTLKDRISSSSLPEKFKKQALEKEGSLSCNFGASASKDKEWIETLLKLPINSFASLPVSKKDTSIEDIKTYFKTTTEKLDEVAYGMDNVKEEIIDCISQMISTNNGGLPRVICLQGSAGCGKTNIIRNGVSKVLNRPFHQINMGGISDADYLIGHESTYVGSKPGMIVQSLINSKVMNPVIFMDEIDKISKTEKGDDIQSVLIHLTDPIQNTDFQDKYFTGLNIDISKVLFIFSCNDESKISPILKDRLNIIRVKEPTVSDKAVIGKKYILKELIPNIGLNEVDIEEEDVKYIINKYCKEDVGLRSLKKCIETILMKINTASYTPSKYKSLKNISFPLKITQKIIDEVIVKKEDKNSEFMNSMFL